MMKSFELEFYTGTKRRWWIGLTDEGTEGNWIWVRSLEEAKYTAWFKNQPNGGTRENFAQLGENVGYLWEDKIVDYEGSYPICQYFTE